MRFNMNPELAVTESPPIPEIQSWAEAPAIPAGLPLLDLLQAVPGYPPDSRLVEHLARCFAEPGLSGYTPIQGLPELRRSFAAELSSKYGTEIPPECILITAGCNQAFFAAVIGLARAGESIFLPTPYYFNHRMTLDMLGVRTIHLPARADGGFLPDPQEAAELMESGTRALVLVSPNNPTGAVYPPGLLERFFELASERRIALILDETYRDFLPADTPRPHDLFRRGDWERTLIHLYSFSKVYSLAGYRVGALAASPGFVDQILKVMDCMVICAPHIAQRAALFGIDHLREWRQQKSALMLERVETFRHTVTDRVSGWTIGCMGAYFAYLRHPFRNLTSLQAAHRLAFEQGLLVLPGSAFGPGQEDYLRLAFANVASARIPEIARRLSDCRLS
jgi:aspartate/methionine/tyrosine aminotransferase